jgi:hypothetical protein
MPGGRSTTDPPGRILGMVVFVVGVLLLIYVFYSAYTELATGALSRLTAPAPQQGPDLNLILALLVRALFLFLLGYLASAIAGRGIGMYQAARAPEPQE